MRLINVADAFSEYIRKACTDALNNYAIQDGLRDEKVTPTIEQETEEEAYKRGYTAGQMVQRKTGEDDVDVLTDEIMERYCKECDNHRCKYCKHLQKWKEDSYSRFERRTDE